MTTPSQTVQTAQRLLAEREQVGLAKYGTTVDRTDLSAADWLQHAIEETADQLLYLMRLRDTMACACKDRPASQCPGEWEPGCDLGNNDAHCVPAPPEASAAVDAALGIDREAKAARWKSAPADAQWLSEDFDGRCDWWVIEPVEWPVVNDGVRWAMRRREDLCNARYAGENLLGSVRCERRPK